MSNNYVQEPSTSGKVILYTSHGELDIELWTRQAPLACRNFIQLCLEGYYDHTIFHRLIPGFMMQGGDPTGTGTGGESIYGGPFKDEYHQRLKFTHRGLVAMANSGPNTNKSQFFITFGECLHLNKKHTIFGKLIGDTMFNLMSMQSIDTEKGTDRPLQPPFIKSTKVLVNPFEDIQPRNTARKQEEQARKEKEKQEAKKRQELQRQQRKEQTKKLKKKNLLSFEDDNEYVHQKIVSSHDALNDSKLSKKTVVTPQQIEAKKKQKAEQQRKKEELKAQLAMASQNTETMNAATQRMRQFMEKHREAEPKIEDEVNNYNTRVNPVTGQKQLYWGEQEKVEEEEEPEEEIEDEKLKELREKQKKELQAIRNQELRFKEIQEGSLNRQQKVLLAQQKPLMSNVQRRRMEFIQKRDLEKHEGSIMEKLEKFKQKLHKSRTDETDEDWKVHRLKFHIDSDNAYKMIDKAQNAGDMDDGGLMVVAAPHPGKRKGLDIDELYRLSKEQTD